MPDEKVIKILLKNGTLDGVVFLQGPLSEVYSVPRAQVSQLADETFGSKFGVYLLLFDSLKAYVGQSCDLSRRLTEHLAQREGWNRAIVLTTPEDRFTHEHIDYLESALIKQTKKSCIGCLNRNRGNIPKVDAFSLSSLKQYLSEIALLFEFLHIKLFQPKELPDVHSKLKVGKRQEKLAARFLREQEIFCGEQPCYATRQEGSSVFWINPKISLLQERCFFILNDIQAEELILLEIPADAISIQKDGLQIRPDKPYVDLNLDAETLIDRKSKVDFSKFVVNRVKY